MKVMASDWAKYAMEESAREANRSRGKQNKRLGKSSEDAVLLRLLALGIQQVCKIETGWTVIFKMGKPVKAFPIAKVAGDFRGILPGGRSVLVESKAHMGKDHNLRWSDFDEHQFANLMQHHVFGGLSLVAYTNPYGLEIMRWPIPSFAQGKSIDPITARVLNLTRLPKG